MRFPTSGGDAARSYAPDDLQVLDDHVAVVRTRPEMYLTSGRFSAQEAVGHIVQAALFAGATALSVVRVPPDRWIVSSSRDWLPSDRTLAVFRRIVRFREAGPNAFPLGSRSRSATNSR